MIATVQLNRMVPELEPEAKLDPFGSRFEIEFGFAACLPIPIIDSGGKLVFSIENFFSALVCRKERKKNSRNYF